jgi:cellulose biosynthesis protein BcsQ
MLQDILAYVEGHAGLFVALGGGVTAVTAIVGCIFQYRSMKRERNQYQHEVARLQQEKVSASETNGAQQQEISQLRGSVQNLENELVQVGAAIEHERQQAAASTGELNQQHATKVQQLSAEIETLHDELDARDQALSRQKNIVKKMMQLEGQLWERRALTGAPRFKALEERRMAIISVLNLKGGVGKTTITAHLAGALAAKGYRVLAVDLDLQGSLSGMFIPGSAIKQKLHEGLLLQHFLNDATHKRKVNLLEFAEPIDGITSSVVPTSDKLAYAEMNLTMSWLLKLARKDTRFLLRRALHQKRISNKYDIVLMDCPPLINTCCVNALAASDYVLIPTMPSVKSTERVPLMLEAIKRFNVHVNQNLKVLGIILNRTHATELTAHEADLLGQLLTQCQDRTGVPVYGFQTVIRQNKEVRQLESEGMHLQTGTELSNTFQALAEELERRLPSECRRSANAPCES